MKYTLTIGIYSLDKKNKKLVFRNLINTTKYSDEKTKVDDLVMNINIQDEIIVSLDKENLVIFFKKIPNTELQADTKLYYKRQK